MGRGGARARPRDEDRPILLSIGYAACHWCHVMEHESFEDAATAAVMNERFVNVKVDREERPDLDAVYMEAVVALSGHGGWPMTVFLTPAGEPFYGGTYYPPEPRHGLPSFRQVLEAIAEAWRERRDDVARSAAQLVEAVRHSAELRPSTDPLTESLLAGAERSLAATFEPAYGGWGRAPKFPNAPALEFLLRRDDEAARAMVVKTLDEMARRRHVRPARRRLPPLLGRRPLARAALREDALRQRAARAAYLHAWLVTGDERYREIAGDGRVHAARAAAAGGRLRLGAGRRHGRRRGADLHLDRGGGRPGRSCSSRSSTAARSSAASSTRRRAPALRVCASSGRSRCATTRRSRPGTGSRWPRSPRPARRLERPDWIEAARRLGEFLLGPLSDADGRLRRSYRDGRTSGAGYLDDYANVAHGLLELHVATGDLRWLREAHRLARLAVELFADDEHGGFFLAPGDGEQLVARTKELDDHPLPSGNSMLAHVLLRLARIYGDDELERRAVSVLRLLRPALERVPSSFGWGLVALDLHLSPPRELAIVGPVDSEVARAALGAVAAEDGRRGRAGRRRTAAGREDARRRAPPSTSASASRAGRR